MIAASSQALPEGADYHALGALLYSQSPDEKLLNADDAAVWQHVPMPLLSRDGAGEMFMADMPAEQGNYGSIRFCHDGGVMFGVLTLDEEKYASLEKSPLRAATYDAYCQIFELLKAKGYPSIFRFWNYMAGINEHSHGLERYRQFNFGRQEAFAKLGSVSKPSIPAACALGFATGPLTVAFMAGREQVTAVENPRQVSAYEYPQQYGPRSPLFSRASLVEQGNREILFLSGTASILGHETLHAGDPAMQTRESVLNIQAVLDEANLKSGQGGYELSRLLYTVYVRHPEHLETVKRELTKIIGQELHAIYLQADICRQELLVEIEGISYLPVNKKR